jgi:hypothetical protein
MNFLNSIHVLILQITLCVYPQNNVLLKKSGSSLTDCNRVSYFNLDYLSYDTICTYNLSENTHESKYIRDSIAEFRENMRSTNKFPTVEAKQNDYNLKINRINVLHKVTNLSGQDEIVVVNDYLYDTSDFDLHNKHITGSLQATEINPHATNMATIIGGSGISSFFAKGVAYNVKFMNSDFNNLYPDALNLFSTQYAFIQNHSYGTITELFYGDIAACYDKDVYANPKKLHVFSAGNAGEESTNYDGGILDNNYANLTGNFKHAKNILVVGAIDLNREVLSISSRGPAYDGRIKPEMVAYSSVGTSNAAALVSGTSILLVEAFKKKYGQQPLNHTLRAILLNSAIDEDLPGPDFYTGYGNLNAYGAWEIIENGTFIQDSILENSSNEYNIPIPKNAQGFKATLVWTDPPASEGAKIALVNNLDFECLDSKNRMWLPWTLKHKHTQLRIPAVRSIDSLNTIEQIYIDELDEEPLNLKVHSKILEGASQHYAIAYQWELAQEFYWTFPLANDVLFLDGSFQSSLEWNTNIRENSASLLINYRNSDKWLFLADEINVGNQFCVISHENLNKGFAQFKLVTSDSVYLSHEVLLTENLNPSVIINCDTISLFNLPKENNHITKIHRPFKNEATDAVFINDTTIIIEAKDDDAYYFTRNMNGFEIRSDLILTENLTRQCYFKYTDAHITADKAIMVNTTLASDYQIDSVTLHHFKNEERILETFTAFNRLDLSFSDKKAHTGTNTYFFLAYTSNGKIYSSDTIQVFYLDEEEIQIFPNPVDEEAFLLSDNLEGELRWLNIYDNNGRLIRSHPIYSENEYIDFSYLPAGIFIARLSSATINYKPQKLIKR